MQEKLLHKKDNGSKAAEKYVGKYLNDLQNHFSLTDLQLVRILNNCVLDIKKRDTEKKWWHIF